MTTFPLILFAMLFAISCKDIQVDKTAPRGSCLQPNIKPIYFTQTCNGDECRFIHTIMLDTYKDECFSDYDFIFLADKYLDTVKTNLPVGAILFLKPFKFDSISSLEEDEHINKNSIIEILYTRETRNEKIPELSSVKIWSNGIEKILEDVNVISRQNRMSQYHDSKE